MSGDDGRTDGGTVDPTDDDLAIQTDVSASVQSRDQRVASTETVVRAENVNVFYNDAQALNDISLEIPENRVTAMIGPSGCGKSTFLRCINRMNDLIAAARVEGNLFLRNKNVYDDDVDPVALRRRVGMVFQTPNPFPKSIYENVAYGLNIQGIEGDYDEIVEE